MAILCPRCKGSGYSIKSCYCKCIDCDGRGEIKYRQACDVCTGRGFIICSSCSGSGRRYWFFRCSVCNGVGLRQCHKCRGEKNQFQNRECLRCKGKRAEVECLVCHGSGLLPCSLCNGSGASDPALALQKLPISKSFSRYHALCRDDVIRAAEGMLLLSTAGDSIYLSSQNSSGSTYHIYRVADGKYML